ncbi:Uncharacterized protein TCM_024879 [Theobroma cacao]|uniref:Uncharacterized protein n=1 Tax=Theobroma cacao TaxID=3641 RepID=A0A061EWJ1_THECC|nr:Uncharacterized protein TCM_024879 [Theobroma cacao]
MKLIRRDCLTKEDESNRNEGEYVFIVDTDICAVLTISEDMYTNSSDSCQVILKANDLESFVLGRVFECVQK